MESHFSHQHSLISLQLEEGDEIDQCQGCQEKISDPSLFRGCLPCDFYLHASCATAPRFLNHPAHPLHPLTLLPTPTYRGRSFGCNACGSIGKAFSYSCACCEFDLHLKCASRPNTIAIKAHKHELELVIDSSYEQTYCTITCDLCEGIVNAGEWVYYCEACNFGTHFGCIAWNGYLQKGKYAEKRKDIPVGKSSNGGNVKKEDPDTEQSLQEDISKARARAKMEELRQELDLQKEIFEVQRKMREQTIANQIVLDALDNAADYVGPSYTRRYYDY